MAAAELFSKPRSFPLHRLVHRPYLAYSLGYTPDRRRRRRFRIVPDSVHPIRSSPRDVRVFVSSPLERDK